VRVFISTSDQYLPLARVHAVLLHKYWPGNEVTILGYQFPSFDLPGQTEFVSLGNQGSWADGLIDYFSDSRLDYFAFGLEDILTVCPANLPAIAKLEKEVAEHRASKAVLSGTHMGGSAVTSRIDGFLEWKQSADYRTSVLEAIWSRGYFLRYLERGMSAWGFETHGGNQAKNDNASIITIPGEILRCVNVYRKGTITDFRSAILPEDLPLVESAVGG